MFILLIVQLEWVQTWLAVAELQPESDISPLGLLLLLLPDLLLLQECLSPNFTASFFTEMPLSMRSRVIQVDRGSRGFGLSLIYRGLDKYEEKETGIFVARYESMKSGSSVV